MRRVRTFPLLICLNRSAAPKKRFGQLVALPVAQLLWIRTAQQGTGMAIAMACAGEGAAVVINYLDDQAAADKELGRIVDAGGKAMAGAGSVTEPTDVERMMAAVDDFGGISILVNNAGIFPRVDFLEIADAGLEFNPRHSRAGRYDPGRQSRAGRLG